MVSALDKYQAASGLTQAQVRQRLLEYGPNDLAEPKRTNTLKILVDQFTSSVVLLLLVAAAISATLQRFEQTVAIIAAVFINAAIGFGMEYNANISLQKLVVLSRLKCRVRRDGQEHQIPATEIVPGDIVLLNAGDMVPADCQILEAAAVTVDESILTGESVPVTKSAGTQDEDQANLLQGTVVAAGRASCLVQFTGRKTRLGSLSKTLENLESVPTPLERKLDKLGRLLSVIAVILSVAFTIGGIAAGLPVLLMIETSVALAIAAIPEGLPVVATLAMALGIQQMVANKALVRKLPAVETLGCTTVICTDKTGTLTENKMLVTELVTFDSRYEITGTGYRPLGEVLNELDSETAVEISEVRNLLRAAALCNDARLENHGEGWHIHGDPTEGALLVAAAKANINKDELHTSTPRVAEIPFDLQRKRMSTLNISDSNGLTLFCKGSPEAVLCVCDTTSGALGLTALTPGRRQWILDENERLASRGLRVIAVCSRQLVQHPACIEADELERGMTFLGLIGMKDPIKPGVEQALSDCRKAGIKVLMLTGDQASTAFAIGKELGICQTKQEVLSGDEIDKISQDQFAAIAKTATVFARVTPELKLMIVKALQTAGHVVAMTGDGVNDALALKQADIGISMGASASSLARDASSLVLTDDNFSTIVLAISNGRQIYNKIKAAIAYLLTASVAALAVVGGAILLNLGILLTALQLLWLNLIVHIFPALGLVLQKDWEDMMDEAPRDPKSTLLDTQLWKVILMKAALVTIATLAGALLVAAQGPKITSTVALWIIGVGLVCQSWGWFDRSRATPASHLLPMFLNSAIAIGLLVAAIIVPVLRNVLETSILQPPQMVVALVLALVAGVPFIRQSNNAAHKS
jgi:P-type Ca2+ transporter type 2C